MTPSAEVGVTGPQLSVAVALPSAALISEPGGLHVNMSEVPVAVMVGAITSAVHVAVRDAVELLPQPSVAVHILVYERIHPVVPTAPSVDISEDLRVA